MMHFMKGVALPFSAAKEWLEVVDKAFRFLGCHRFYPPVLKKSLFCVIAREHHAAELEIALEDTAVLSN